MTALFKPFLLAALLMLGLVAPDFAFAQQVRPPGATDWDLYVYGNGRVVFDILMGIKMLMVPDSGETGFVSLLLVMATLGFLTLAVAAGFDPGKNLLKMFGYILVVWLVTFGSTKLTANVVIIDLARAQNGTAASEPYRVSGAPALVVLPAALTSEVGQYFTRVIETYFTVPGEFKLSGQGVGQFNLFGKMMQESTQYVLTSPELKRSLSAYTADCVVPTMALGKLKGPVRNPDGTDGEGAGTEALLRSYDMTSTLATAANPAILTTYFPFSTKDTAWQVTAKNEAGELGKDLESLERYQSTGVLVSCASSWTMLSTDLKNHAELLVKAGADSWSKSGIMVPFETAMTTLIAQTAAPGAVLGANYSRPSGFILQQAMVNSMNGSFRQAAIQTGNNELMQAAALSQAEQQQKSAWAASFSVFNNMMGYVFTVLQAFIFALTPLIVIALMVPGLGRSIFANYAQVLIWLTLWQPMLALINFIIVLFATESLSTTVTSEGGLSMANKALLSEKTNDLMIAAGFLGTMTPLLSWGIVKGAMAFTEFISKGVGSEFSSQAGASAATGNLNMNNLSMDNASMNKYSTAMSSQVGAQGVSMDMSAGALNGKQDAGGSAVAMNGDKVSLSKQLSAQHAERLAETQEYGKALTQMQEQRFSQSQVEKWARGEGATDAQRMAAQEVLARQEAISQKKSASENKGDNSTLANSDGTGKSTNARTELGAQVGLSTPGISPVKAGGTYSTALGSGDTQEQGTNAQRAATDGTGVSKDIGSSLDLSSGKSVTTANESTHTKSSDHGTGLDRSTSLSEAINEAKSMNQRLSAELSAAQSYAENLSMSDGNSLGATREHISRMEAEQERFISRGQQLVGNYESAGGSFNQAYGATGAKIQSERGSIERVHGNLGAAGGAGPSDAALRKEFNDGKAAADKHIADQQTRIQKGHADVNAESQRRRGNNGATKVSDLPTQGPGGGKGNPFKIMK